MTVVPMAPRHLDALARLEETCFAEPWTREGLAAELESDTAVFAVAEVSGETAGYAGMHRILDECYVDNVAVFPRFRRHGAAAALMEYLIEDAKKNGALFLSLEVRPSNAAALALYAKFGFRQAGIRRDFYRLPKEDALILTLFFKQPGPPERRAEP